MKARPILLTSLCIVLLASMFLAAGCSADDPLTDDLYLTGVYAESLTLQDIELDEQFLFNYDRDILLYAPLWGLYGDTFISSGLNPQLMTVTEASWTNQGRSFDGIDDVIMVDLDSSTLSTFTVAFYGKYTAIRNFDAIIGDGWQEYGGGFLVHMGADGTIYAGTDAANRITTAAGTLVADEWCFLIFTRDASGNLALYKNSISVGTSSGSAAPSGSSGISIGALVGYGEYSECIIGDVLIYDRVLSAAERAGIYNAIGWRYD